MKKLSIYAGLAVIFLLNTAAFCSRDDDNQTIVLQDTEIIKAAMMQGSWRITEYKDHGQDETDHFTGYDFTFEADNVLTATDGSHTYTGAWTLTTDKTDDESPNNPLDFNIVFAAPADFEDISDDWDLVSRTADKLVLIDVSDSGTDIDNITFEKN
jgi:hypothetical protein